jgi:hypothetical protein
MDFIQPGQGKENWRTFVSTVMKFWAPQKRLRNYSLGKEPLPSQEGFRSMELGNS